MSEAAKTIRITKRVVDAIKPDGSDFYVFDSELIGFGVRVRKTGAMSYIVRYRSGFGRSAPVRRVTVAKVGKVTPEQARESAKGILASVVNGKDPARDRADERSAPTFSQLTERFLEHVEATRKPNTLAQYKHMLNTYAVPEFGTRKAAAVAASDIASLHLSLRKKSTTANRVRAIVGAMYSWAIKTKVLAISDNPVTGVERYREDNRERFLTSEEISRLAEAIREGETDGIPWQPDPSKKTKHAPKAENRRTKIDPNAAAAIRLLLLTGARLREILHLKWAHVDFERGLLLLPDSKTGRKTIILNAPALAILNDLKRIGVYVIAGETAGTKGEKPRADLKRPWALVTKRAGLEGLRIHDLRHSFASFGAGGGMGLPIIGKLLGHTQAATTQRYAHLDADPLRKASNAIGATIAAAMRERRKDSDEPEAVAEIIPLHRKDA
ncbi:site-specific integrase [Aerobium aerolatum]|uniref:Site-specific recombinase XerD n=1 Tax=Aquamicrobium aerolatum DSM 21857 TaxID=1121003 RepID=A0A1I3SSN9_9HYPH|nr:site-specific integrase [Aquamicrobium aerolatum]SFJ61413.1 Site-specific recombinase XerD [Aquamicrobium aerolatum DSM 21857]